MNNIQNNYLKNLGRNIRKQMREKGLTVYDFGSGERMVDKSTISRIINSKENLSRNKLDIFIETLVLKNSFCLYFHNNFFCYELIESTLELIEREKTSCLYKILAKLLREKYVDFSMLDTYSLVRIYFVNNRDTMTNNLQHFMKESLTTTMSSFEVAKLYEKWIEDYLRNN
ncbi:helix-turn-helix domain-containing protein [Streptococcus suis]|uniref:N-terminal Ras-GEF domain-containing protein n=1 Tax=Streptococcus suis TaxID=1307 RepID=A0AB33UC22_STRSU|nr:helix-turn-helix transcriptional regulator [Streptococcus suis]NQH63982.1 helix-turn-helix transcriptional regulator [Streptococcus suis]NQS07091.1 helix-turn-helix transcriptional regulator [Streptococcus suis]CYU90208.1 Uncharacterised protein [Streptococcus suis]CYX69003.1 Uncharacterised protein [Streptococcus suis]